MISLAFWGTRTRLQQVLLNLFLNAAAAMPEGGILNVITRVEDYSGCDRGS